MKRFLVVLCVSVLDCSVAAYAVQVEGYAYLHGQQNAAGIRVVLRAVAPPAESDSFLTNNIGHFWGNVPAGTYDVEYRHAGYALYRLPNRELLTNTTLPPVTLLPPLAGDVSGTLGPGDFHVTDSLVVAANASLEILPGTHLFFESHSRFVVYGRLSAVGTWEDSILFTRRTVSDDSLWGGIRLVQAHDSSRLDYCTVEYARSLDNDWSNAGGGMLIYFCGPTISHCTIRFNAGAPVGNSGGGMACLWSYPHLSDCVIAENVSGDSLSGNGGGVTCSGGAPVFQHCTIRQNRALVGGGVFTGNGSAALFDNCDIAENAATSGGGVAAYSHSFLHYCRISDNAAVQGGGVAMQIGPELTHCIISGNTATSGGGMFCDGGSGHVAQCTIADNTALTADAVYFSHTHAEFNSCILAANDTLDILYFVLSANAELGYCDIFAPDTLIFGFDTLYENNWPPDLAVPAGSNANGDTCDGYFNIFRDPQFVDAANGDYHVPETSPCIDAGDPFLPHDPDGSLADIGAYYWGEIDATDGVILHPSSFILSAYPNPFNAATTFKIELPQPERITLVVYDISGRAVSTLLNDNFSAGEHGVSFDAGRLPSGIYFARLRAGAAIQTRRMILIK